MTAPAVQEMTEQTYRIPDSEPVTWEGEETTWGQLSGNERMSCERNINGVLEGGNPF